MEPRLTVLFCEDIRHEIGGKKSLIGILGEKIHVQKFPLVMPKICCHFTFEMLQSEIPQQSLLIKLMVDGTEKQGVDVPASAFINTEPSEHGWVRLMGAIESINFQISQPCEVSLVLIVDGREYSTPYTSMLIDIENSDQEH